MRCAGLALLVSLLIAVPGCGDRPAPASRSGPAGPPPAAAPRPEDPWFTVHPGSLPARIYWEAPVPPRAVRKPAVRLPDRVPQGNVIVRVIISEQGQVLRAQILRGPGSGREVDSAAVEALKGWRFEPATLQGKPVAVYMNLVLEPAGAN